MAEPIEPEGPACHSYGESGGVYLPPKVRAEVVAGMEALDRECAEAEVERRPGVRPILYCPFCRAELDPNYIYQCRNCAASVDQTALRPVPHAPMNATERARRAEILGEELAAACMDRAGWSNQEAWHLRLGKALQAWAAHRARLDAQGVPR